MPVSPPPGRGSPLTICRADAVGSYSGRARWLSRAAARISTARAPSDSFFGVAVMVELLPTAPDDRAPATGPSPAWRNPGGVQAGRPPKWAISGRIQLPGMPRR
jgi:hypothetical protein